MDEDEEDDVLSMKSGGEDSGVSLGTSEGFWFKWLFTTLSW